MTAENEKVTGPLLTVFEKEQYEFVQEKIEMLELEEEENNENLAFDFTQYDQLQMKWKLMKKIY